MIHVPASLTIAHPLSLPQHFCQVQQLTRLHVQMLFPGLPPEIASIVIDKVLNEVPPRSSLFHPYNTPGAQAAEIVKADASLSDLVQHRLASNAVLFTPDGEPLVFASLGAWIPQASTCHFEDHLEYSKFHYGPTWPSTIDLQEQTDTLDNTDLSLARVIRVDARAPGLSRSHDCAIWMRENLDLVMASGLLLCRLGSLNPSLRVLHLRLSAFAGMYPLVGRIISTSHRLTDIVLEDDTHPDLDGLRRPVLDLAVRSLVSADDQPAPLERLVIRGPAVQLSALDDDLFLLRLSKATTLCLAVHSVTTRTSTWVWALRLLKHAPKLQEAELSLASKDRVSLGGGLQPIPTASLPDLKHLTLDLPEVDQRLLYRLAAPSLKHLRIRCGRDLGSHGDVPVRHFPSLFCVTVWCPGPAVDRFLALGLLKRQFHHSLCAQDLTSSHVDKAILVYVKALEKVYSPAEIDDLRPTKRLRQASGRQ